MAFAKTSFSSGWGILNDTTGSPWSRVKQRSPFNLLAGLFLDDRSDGRLLDRNVVSPLTGDSFCSTEV